jgi:hypothetical protein
MAGASPAMPLPPDPDLVIRIEWRLEFSDRRDS